MTVFYFLVLPLAGFLLLMGLLAFRWLPRIGDDRLNRAHSVFEIVAHALTAIGIFTIGFLYIQEKQWAPRFAVDVKTDVREIPRAPSRTAVVQVAISIKNDGRTSQTVNYIEVAALSLGGAVTSDPNELQDLKGDEFFRHQTTREIGIGPGETEYQYVEIPVNCERSLVRLIIKVPVPPAEERKPGEKIPVYERKVLVQLGAACGTAAAD